MVIFNNQGKHGRFHLILLSMALTAAYFAGVFFIRIYFGVQYFVMNRLKNRSIFNNLGEPHEKNYPVQPVIFDSGHR